MEWNSSFLHRFVQSQNPGVSRSIVDHEYFDVLIVRLIPQIEENPRDELERVAIRNNNGDTRPFPYLLIKPDSIPAIGGINLLDGWIPDVQVYNARQEFCMPPCRPAWYTHRGRASPDMEGA